MEPATTAAPPSGNTRRKRSRQPTSLSHNTLAPPTGLRYPTQLLYAARSGHTALLNIRALHADFVAFQNDLSAQLAVLPPPPPPPSLEDVRLQAPYRLIAERMEAEVAAVGEWMREAEAEVREQQRKQAEEQQQMWLEHKRKEREDRAARRQRDRAAKATAASLTAGPPLTFTESKEEAPVEAAAKEERKEAADERKEVVQAIPDLPLLPRLTVEQLAVAEARVEAKESEAAPASGDGQMKVESDSQAAHTPVSKPTRRTRAFSASLSSPSTATSSLQLSAGVDLPPTFGASVPSHSELMEALLPSEALAALPLTLFPPVVDFNSLTPELFVHRLQKKLQSAAGGEGEAPPPPPPLPPHTPLLRVSVYAPASERKQQEVIVHGEQTLEELMAVIKCSAKHLPTAPPTAPALGASTADTAPRNTEFVYIERTMYPSATTPHSALQPVLDFLAAHADSAPLYPPAIAPAASTHVAALSVRLGSHYLYHHAADCCHALVVDGVEFLSSGGQQHVADRRAYPLVVYERGERRRLCGGCRMASAVCCMYGDMLSDVEPLLLCGGCEKLLHCDNQGAQLYDNYTVYRL